MQIIIPMSGFGERFRAAGYSIPKPLIEVDGKTIIQHVVEMFPGENDITFICNKDQRFLVLIFSKSTMYLRFLIFSKSIKGKLVIQPS